MSWIRFRAAFPVAMLVMVSSMVFIDAPGADDSKHPARRQAAESSVGAPKRQAAERAVGASRRRAPERGLGAWGKAATADGAKPTLASPADSGAAAGAVSRDSSAAGRAEARPDSANGHARPAKGPARGSAERDSTTRKPADRDEPREDAPVRGPRLPVWPGISMANPSAERVMFAAAW